MSDAGPTPQRLGQIDALRGLAAMAVVLYHYSTRFGQLYPQAPQPSWALPGGHFGVNLFFIISGFVIFMTITRTRRPADFVVSRFSRLYPAYWAAVALTFAITLGLSLPGKTVNGASALANLLMFHGLFGVPHVDGVYWTLEVELLFYAMALLLFTTRQLARVHLFLLALLALRLAYQASSVLLHVDLSWTISRLLILPFIPWFALGICIYQWSRPAGFGSADKLSTATAGGALLSLAAVDSLGIALLALVFGAAVLAAAQGRLRWLENRWFVWLGAISYPLYLLHENIGWAVMLQLTNRGWPPDLAVAVTLLAVLALSDGLHRAVERPAMGLIRKLYRQRIDGAEVRQA